MHTNHRKAAVNWVDGMKINKNHFQQTEDWFVDNLKELAALSLTDYSYGLLPTYDEAQASINFQIDIEQTQFVKVNLLGCRAITRGGLRIEITHHLSKFLSPEKNKHEIIFNLRNTPNQQYDIVVIVDPFSRIPVGDPDPDEHPLRHPFAIPKYSVDVVPTNQVNAEEFSTYHLTIGKFKVLAGEVQVEDYIPPCASLQSHPALQSFYNEFHRILSEMKDHLTKYIKKVRSHESAYNVNENVLALAESMVMTQSIFWDEFTLEIKAASPLQLFKYIIRHIRLISTELSLMPEDERLKVYEAFNRSVGANSFETTIATMLSLPYRHRDLYQTFSTLYGSFRQFAEIIAKLPYTEYPVQPKPEVEKVKENIPQPESPKTFGSTVKILRGGKPVL